MTLSEWDEALNEAKAAQEHAAGLYRAAKEALEAEELELHRAPSKNEDLAQAIALSELDGTDAPTEKPVDIAALERKVAVLRTRAATFGNGMIEASNHQARVTEQRQAAYKSAYREKAQSFLPQANPSLRRSRPSLHDFGNIKLDELWAAYLLTHGGNVSRNPNSFGEFMGSLFAMPDVGDDWPAIRDEAVVWYEDQSTNEVAA